MVKLDSFDADHIEQTMETDGYRSISARMIRTMELQIGKLRSRSNQDETNYNRGYLDALQFALGLPAVMIKEARKQP